MDKKKLCELDKTQGKIVFNYNGDDRDTSKKFQEKKPEEIIKKLHLHTFIS